MFKASLPTGSFSARSSRATYQSPRPPNNPAPRYSSRRTQKLSNQEMNQNQTLNSFNKDVSDVSNSFQTQEIHEIPEFHEDPSPPLTFEQKNLQQNLDYLFVKNELNGIFDYALKIANLNNSNNSTKHVSFNNSKNNNSDNNKTENISNKVTNSNNLNLNLNIMKKYRNAFLEREYEPKLFKHFYTPVRDGFKNDLSADHTLEVQSYLHFKSDSLLKDLSIVFGTTLNESYIADPNPIFDAFLQTLQTETAPFLLPYQPYEKIPFPFIVCIGGPPGSGRTTVAQFFQKAFDCHIVDVRQDFTANGRSSKKGTSSKNLSQDLSNTAISAMDMPPEYPLLNAISVRYPDEKSAPNLIAQAMKEYMADSKGFVIDGFPNNKTQQSALDKALGIHGVCLKPSRMPTARSNPMNSNPASAKRTAKSSRAVSKSSRALLNCIDGYIITMYTESEENKENGSVKLVDPVSGNIFKIGFHHPGLADLLGVVPTHFEESAREIQSRLVDVPVNYPVLSTKQLAQYKAFAGALEKSCSNTIIVTECESALQVLEILDNFVSNLYAKSPGILVHESPMISLLRPTVIIRPQMCFSAITTWYRCLEEFGRPMADQSNLISTFSSKVELLSKAAMERYQLLISQKDERIDLCEAFMEKYHSQYDLTHNTANLNNMTNANISTTIRNDKNENKNETKENGADLSLAALFRKVWDMSIQIRNSNLELVDQIIDRCGLIELLLELRKAPKLVFIAMAHRLLNIMWFTDTFSHIPYMEINDRSRFPFFDELIVPKIPIPKYNFMCSVKPAPLKAFRSMYQINKLIESSKPELKSTNNNIANQINTSTSIDGRNNNTSNNTVTNTPRLARNNNINSTNNTSNYSISDALSNALSHIPGNGTGKATMNLSFHDFNNKRNSIERQRPTISRTTHEIDQAKLKENKNTERKHLAGIRGFDYLQEILQSLRERPEDKIFFNSDSACTALGIIKMEAKSSFETQPVKFAEEFFGHVEKLLDSKMVAQEAKISLKLYRRFTTLCKRKEVAMVNSVFDLRDSLMNYAYNKCTKEMEMFARKFRFMKQGGRLPRNVPLFRYDMSKINEDVLHLADLSMMIEPPIFTQELVSVKTMLELAQRIVNKGQKFTSASLFMETARECSNVNEIELMKLELALRVVECIECFDSQKFLRSFIRNKDDESKLNDIFKRPPQNIISESPKIFPRRPEKDEMSDDLSDFSYYSLEEEEEEFLEEEDE
ncbi:hypothetical protein TRFO_14694 [Tritrichomonas foetus]|uniref:Uncharacterized protein n=1 Tax=Tritrichomonas foetus TaxID=1144522 RepID=A0A1J4KUF2_9EUKA|nr:hypothetical protein TRFO_14694 [Tritrichomonas foetus]|eukprot:OHT14899.1 hypothetical protein TRFO_14694 [Tritrichomonas foetus]